MDGMPSMVPSLFNGYFLVSTKWLSGVRSNKASLWQAHATVRSGLFQLISPALLPSKLLIQLGITP